MLCEGFLLNAFYAIMSNSFQINWFRWKKSADIPHGKVYSVSNFETYGSSTIRRCKHKIFLMVLTFQCEVSSELELCSFINEMSTQSFYHQSHSNFYLIQKIFPAKFSLKFVYFLEPKKINSTSERYQHTKKDSHEIAFMFRKCCKTL